MNKFLKYALVGVLTMFALVATGCGGSKDDGKVDMNKPVIVCVNPGPHAIIMDNVKKIAEKKGLKIEVKEFSDSIRSAREEKENKARQEEEARQRQVAEEQRIREESQRKAEEEYRKKQDDERRKKAEQARQAKEALERRLADKKARIQREVENCKNQPEETTTVDGIAKKAAAAFLDNPYRILGVSCLATNEEANTACVLTLSFRFVGSGKTCARFERGTERPCPA